MAELRPISIIRPETEAAGDRKTFFGQVGVVREQLKLEKEIFPLCASVNTSMNFGTSLFCVYEEHMICAIIISWEFQFPKCNGE